MVTIKNKEQLIKNGKTAEDRKARRLALESLEAALDAVDPRKIIQSRVKMKSDVLSVDECCFDLAKFKNVYVIGGGKASGSMAEALERVLDGRSLKVQLMFRVGIAVKPELSSFSKRVTRFQMRLAWRGHAACLRSCRTRLKMIW